jgi:hypothetical protein
MPSTFAALHSSMHGAAAATVNCVKWLTLQHANTPNLLLKHPNENIKQHIYKKTAKIFGTCGWNIC